MTRKSLFKAVLSVLLILAFIAIIYVLLVPKQQTTRTVSATDKFPEGHNTVAQIQPGLSDSAIDDLYLSLRRLRSIESLFPVLSEEIEKGMLQLPSEMSGSSDVFLIKTPDREALLQELRQQPQITMVSTLSKSEVRAKSTNSLPGWLKVVLLVADVLLIGLAFYLIKSTSRDVLDSWEGEVQIMKYSGVSRSSVKFPLMVFGVVLGLAGSILSILLLIALSTWASSGIWLSSQLAGLQSNTHFLILSVWSILLGMVVGFLSSLFSLCEVDSKWETNSISL